MINDDNKVKWSSFIHAEPCALHEEREPIDYTSVKVNTDINLAMNTLAHRIDALSLNEEKEPFLQAEYPDYISIYIVNAMQGKWEHMFLNQTLTGFFELPCPIVHFKENENRSDMK